MTGVVVALALVGSLTLEEFFVGSLIGLLLLSTFVVPLNVTPRWRTRLRWLTLVGLAVFGYLVVRHVVAILPPGLF
jgi:multisubunit Na+/H+ antiporter MnhE subunit